MNGYPKRMQLGCLWLEVCSKLHERLITGLLLSMLYVLGYWMMVIDTLKMCDSCIYEVACKVASIAALSCYIPAVIMCLCSVKRLDAVMEVIVDIRNLQEMKREVELFSLQIRGDGERQKLLQALKDRVFGRIEIVTAFTVHVLQLDVRENPHEIKRGVRALVECLEEVEEVLGEPCRWLTKSEMGQRQKALWLHAQSDRFNSASSFFILGSGSSADTSALAITIVPSQAALATERASSSSSREAATTHALPGEEASGLAVQQAAGMCERSEPLMQPTLVHPGHKSTRIYNRMQALFGGGSSEKAG